MKADQRKEIETNSLVLAVQRMRERMTGRTIYYVIGTVAVVVGAVLLYRYLTGERSKTRDAGLLQLVAANTPEKLKQGIEDHRGTLLGSLFKLQLARHYLLDEGLPKLGTDSGEQRKAAANAVAEARTYYLDLTGEFKDKEERALLQEAWLGAAQAEEALVGLPTAEGGTDSRGSADKVIEYYEKAASFFPDTEFSKRYKEHADKIKANKDQFVSTQKQIYAPRPAVPGFEPPPAKGGPLGTLPPLPGTEPPPTPKPGAPITSTTTTTPPPAPKTGTTAGTTTTTTPPAKPSTTPQPKKTSEPPKGKPKAK
jgi:hypothetical protein